MVTSSYALRSAETDLSRDTLYLKRTKRNMTMKLVRITDLHNADVAATFLPTNPEIPFINTNWPLFKNCAVIANVWSTIHYSIAIYYISD